VENACGNRMCKSALNLVKFITEDRMPRNTYLYLNRIFTNKVEPSTIWGGKGKDRVMFIKSLINARVKEALEGCTIKGIGQSDQKV
jgi:hypothetical protein